MFWFALGMSRTALIHLAAIQNIHSYIALNLNHLGAINKPIFEC